MSAPDCVDGFPVTEIAGYRAHTVARSTGTLVVLAETTEFGLSVDDGGRWLLVCDPHAGILQCDTQRAARRFLSAPEEWCPICQETVETP